MRESKGLKGPSRHLRSRASRSGALPILQVYELSRDAKLESSNRDFQQVCGKAGS
jgi:hypothetical protein